MMHPGYDRFCDAVGSYPLGPLYLAVLFLLLLLGIVSLAVRLGCRDRTLGQGEESPLDIIKRRYAKGEITREEFEQFKKDLDL